MKTAILVKEVKNTSEFHQQVFKMEPPYEGEEFVFISKVNRYVPLIGSLRETYIFPSDDTYDVKSWSEMSGSRKGNYSIYEILEGIGYTFQYPSTLLLGYKDFED